MGRAKQGVIAGHSPPRWHLALSSPLLPTEPLQQPAHMGFLSQPPLKDTGGSLLGALQAKKGQTAGLSGTGGTLQHTPPSL